MDLVKYLFKYGHPEADRSTLFSCLSVHTFRFISVSLSQPLNTEEQKRRRETERDGMKTREGVGEREREGLKERE